MSKKKIYKFSLENFEGEYCGWNDVVATSMAEARRLAKKQYTTKPKWIHYEVIVDGKVEPRKEWYLGMRPALKTFRRQTFEENYNTHRLAQMMSR